MRRVILLLAVSVLPACISFGDKLAPSSSPEPGATLIERSKEVPPAWTELEAGRLHQNSSHYQYVEVRTRLPNLAFGLNQCQMGALEASEHELRDLVRRQIFTYARSQDIPMVGSMAELDRELAESAKQVHQTHAKIADIYFEKFRLDSPEENGLEEYYKAHVLVHFPKERFVDFLTDAGQRLARSRDLNLRRLGQVVNEMARQNVSH